MKSDVYTAEGQTHL